MVFVERTIGASLKISITFLCYFRKKEKYSDDSKQSLNNLRYILLVNYFMKFSLYKQSSLSNIFCSRKCFSPTICFGIFNFRIKIHVSSEVNIG